MRKKQNECHGVEVFMFSADKCANLGDKINFQIDIRNNSDRYIFCELFCLLPKGMTFITGRVETPLYCYPLTHLCRVQIGNLMCGECAKVTYCAVVTGRPCSEILDHCAPRRRCKLAYFSSATLLYSHCSSVGERRRSERTSNIVTMLMGDA